MIDRSVRIRVRLRQWWWDVSDEVGGSQDDSPGGDWRRRRGGTMRKGREGRTEPVFSLLVETQIQDGNDRSGNK